MHYEGDLERSGRICRTAEGSISKPIVVMVSISRTNMSRRYLVTRLIYLSSLLRQRSGDMVSV